MRSSNVVLYVMVWYYFVVFRMFELLCPRPGGIKR